MSTEQPVPRFFLVLVVASVVLLGLVIAPIAREIFLAAVLSGMLWPVQRWLAARLGGRRGVAAGIITIITALLLIGPLATVITFIARDGNEALAFVRDAAASVRVREILAWLPEGARHVAQDGIARLPKDLGDAVGFVDAQSGRAAVVFGARFLLSGAFMLIALFFLLVRGDRAVDWLDHVSPLRTGQTRELLSAVMDVAFAVIVATVVTAGVQAIAALVGYLISRVPNPVFFTVATFFLAFIPAIGAAVVCLVAAFLLFVTGHPYMAIFLAAWGTIIVGLVDNVAKPLLIKRGMELHGAVVFFALVGGLAAFGSIGLLIGPIAVAFFLALVRMYHRDFSPDKQVQPDLPGEEKPAEA